MVFWLSVHATILVLFNFLLRGQHKMCLLCEMTGIVIFVVEMMITTPSPILFFAQKSKNLCSHILCIGIGIIAFLLQNHKPSVNSVSCGGIVSSINSLYCSATTISRKYLYMIYQGWFWFWWWRVAWFFTVIRVSRESISRMIFVPGEATAKSIPT